VLLQLAAATEKRVRRVEKRVERSGGATRELKIKVATFLLNKTQA
jgi:hypothetical protein